jgi:radical SAM protein with 4Fe4S-binding SPASM domain
MRDEPPPFGPYMAELDVTCRCHAGLLMVRVDPWGNVYPCLEQHVRVGSVREQDFSTVWQSESLREVRRRLRTDTRCECSFNNTAMISHCGAMLQWPRSVFHPL